MKKAKGRNIQKEKSSRAQHPLQLADSAINIWNPLMIDHARADYGIERVLRKWQRGDITLLRIGQTALVTKRDRFGGKIDPDISIITSKPLQDCARSTPRIENPFRAPVGQFPIECLKYQLVQRAVPPMRFFDA